MSPQRIHLWAQRDQFVNRLGRNPKLGIEAHFPRKIFHSIHFHIYLLSWEAFGGISLCFWWRWKSFTADYYEGNQRGKKIQFIIKKITFCSEMTSDDPCCWDQFVGDGKIVQMFATKQRFSSSRPSSFKSQNILFNKPLVYLVWIK